MRPALVLCALALAACAPSDPEVLAEQRYNSCQTSMFPQQRLIDCSAIIADPGVSDDRRVQALISRGSQRARLGEHARAVADFGRALRIDAENALAYFERGAVHHDRGAYESAVASYDAALAIQPDFDMALRRRAEALEYVVDPWRGEIAWLDQALAQDPTNVELLNNRCWTRAVNGDDLALALADCDAAIRLNARYGAVLDSRGLVHLKRGDFQAAFADYDAALALEPNNGHYLYGRGLARQGLGAKDEAATDLARAEAAEPGIGAQYATYGL